MTHNVTWTADCVFVDAVYPSPNAEPRRGCLKPDILLLHYTGLESVTRSIEVLANPAAKVSCHYVVDEAGQITQMVPEALRAWHAGVAFWDGETDINSLSIGIEIQNPGHAGNYPEFPEAQMKAVERLSLDIVQRHNIPARRVLGHSDVAPARKQDPGEKFDWQRLADAGAGKWISPAPLDLPGPEVRLGDTGRLVKVAQGLLAQYGYGIDTSGTFDRDMEAVVTAFQRHFRPARCDGVLDASTQDTLRRLVDATT